MELSRQRLQPSLEETAHINCPRCSGTGFIRGTESTALHVLRIMQEEAMKENTGAVHCQVPVDVASFLLNEKRSEIQKLEARLKVNIVMVPNPHLETPHYKVQRLRHDELNEMEHVPASYEMVQQPEEPKAPGADEESRRERQEAVVKGITPAQPAPLVSDAPRVREPAPAPAPRQPAQQVVQPVASAAEGFLSRIFSIFKPPAAPQAPGVSRQVAQPAAQPAAQPRREQPRRDQQQPRRDGRPNEPRRGEGRREGRGREEHRDRQQQGRLEQRRNGQQRGPQREQQPRPPQQARPQQPPQSRPEQQPRPEQQNREGGPREGEEHRRGGRRHRRDRPRREEQLPPNGSPAPMPAAAEPSVRQEQPRYEAIREEQRREAQRLEEALRAEEARIEQPPAPREAPIRIEEPKIDSKALLESSGLVMIETDRSKAQHMPEQEAPQPLGRPRRERARSMAQEEELQQVETRK
jgi:ribonuclease E